MLDKYLLNWSAKSIKFENIFLFTADRAPLPPIYPTKGPTFGRDIPDVDDDII